MRAFDYICVSVLVEGKGLLFCLGDGAYKGLMFLGVLWFRNPKPRTVWGLGVLRLGLLVIPRPTHLFPLPPSLIESLALQHWKPLAALAQQNPKP